MIRSRKSRRHIAAVLLAAATLAGLSVSAPSASAARIPTVIRRVTPNFGLRFVEDVQAVTAGETATYRFDVSSTSTFKGAVIFDLPNLTDRFTGQVFAESATRIRLELTVPPLANTNSGVFLLRGRSGLLSRQAMFRLNVTARPVPTTTTTLAPPVVTTPPQFTLALDVASRSGLPGEQQQYGINVNRPGGFGGPIAFQVDGLPTGTTASFSPNPTLASTVLYMTPTATTPSGSYPISIIASAGSTVRVTSVLLVVRRNGDFNLGVAPSLVTVPRGNDAVAGLNVLRRNGSAAATPDVTFTASGLPAGATAFFDPNPSNGLGTVRIRTSRGTPIGTYNVIISGRSGTFAMSIALRVAVVERVSTGGFGLSASPVNVPVAPGGSALVTVAITPTSGFTAPIAFRVNGLPQFASFALVSQTTTSAVIRVTTGATTPSGSSTLQIIGESGTLSATVEVVLAVS